MASEDKKRKLKNSHGVATMLKHKTKGPRGTAFYTSSKRSQIKREFDAYDMQVEIGRKIYE